GYPTKHDYADRPGFSGYATGNARPAPTIGWSGTDGPRWTARPDCWADCAATLRPWPNGGPHIQVGTGRRLPASGCRNWLQSQAPGYDRLLHNCLHVLESGQLPARRRAGSFLRTSDPTIRP